MNKSQDSLTAPSVPGGDVPQTITSVGFVIPAHNEEKHLALCLQSVLAQVQGLTPGINVSLVVVDNASTDATASIAMDYGATVVQAIPGNPGRARNAGAAASGAGLLAFVDADCVLPSGWLRYGLEQLSDRRVAAVGAIQAVAPPGAPWVERVWLETIMPPASSQREHVTWLPAFNLLLRKSDFETLRGFDESLTTCEDSDLSFRLSARGELLRDHSHPVLHLGESKSLTEFFRRELWRSRGNFRSAIKRGSVRKEFLSLFLPLSYVIMLVMAVVALIAALMFAGSGWKLASVCWAYVLIIPVSMAILKRRSLAHWYLATLLFAAYLLARGMGPFWSARRVSKR